MSPWLASADYSLASRVAWVLQPPGERARVAIWERAEMGVRQSWLHPPDYVGGLALFELLRSSQTQTSRRRPHA